MGEEAMSRRPEGLQGQQRAQREVSEDKEHGERPPVKDYEEGEDEEEEEEEDSSIIQGQDGASGAESASRAQAVGASGGRGQSSGFRGVSWDNPDKKVKRWRAQLKVSGKKHFLGLFNTEEAAARAVDDFVRQQGLEQVKGLNLPTAEEAAQGLQCKKGKHGNSTASRFIGVSFTQATGKWVSQIKIDRQLHRLGTFNTEAAAAAAYDRAAARLGRPLNFPDRNPDNPSQSFLDSVATGKRKAETPLHQHHATGNKRQRPSLACAASASNEPGAAEQPVTLAEPRAAFDESWAMKLRAWQDQLTANRKQQHPDCFQFEGLATQQHFLALHRRALQLQQGRRRAVF